MTQHILNLIVKTAKASIFNSGNGHTFVARLSQLLYQKVPTADFCDRLNLAKLPILNNAVSAMVLCSSKVMFVSALKVCSLTPSKRPIDLVWHIIINVDNHPAYLKIGTNGHANAKLNANTEQTQGIHRHHHWGDQLLEQEYFKSIHRAGIYCTGKRLEPNLWRDYVGLLQQGQ
jgi:hypothetical protein